MNRLPITQVDAFADRPFTGNPAAVMPLETWLLDEVLQAIAEENNVAETAFFLPIKGDVEADFELRWFTPALEVALCGHATLATGHVILSADPRRDAVRFRTRKAGVLTVARGLDGGYELALPAYRPEPLPLPAIVAALGLEESAVETFWHSGGYALVVLKDAAAVRALDPDFRKLGAEGDVLTISTAPGEQTDIVSRVFAPGAGIDEDPVTGSAHAVLVPWWAERLGRISFSAWQASKRGGRLACRLAGEQVVLGGRCTTVIEGYFSL